MKRLIIFLLVGLLTARSLACYKCEDDYDPDEFDFCQVSGTCKNSADSCFPKHHCLAWPIPCIYDNVGPWFEQCTQPDTVHMTFCQCSDISDVWNCEHDGLWLHCDDLWDCWEMYDDGEPDDWECEAPWCDIEDCCDPGGPGHSPSIGIDCVQNEFDSIELSCLDNPLRGKPGWGYTEDFCVLSN
jgi:hypothetical protein